MSPADDPASLDRLHDIALPPAVAWWPPAPGWYVVLATGIAVCAWLGWRRWMRWRAEAYRRAAARAITASTELAEIAQLLRRTALVAFPREHVAALSGDAWLEFLDRSSGTRDFSDGPGRILATAAYAPGGDQDAGVADRVRACATRWVWRHRAWSGGPPPC